MQEAASQNPASVEASSGPASPPHGEKIPALDGVRGLAIAGVLLSHFLWKAPEWENTGWWRALQSGWLGVDLFFVLSGFLITGILLRTRSKSNYFGRFYRRRALRIMPLYYAAVLLNWLWVALIDGTLSYHQGYDHPVWFFLFLPNLAIAFKGDWLYTSNMLNLNHLWSVAVEEQFYLIWPLLVRWLPVRWLAALCAALLLGSPYLRTATDAALGESFSLATYTLPYCRLDGLAAGSFLAIVRYLDWRIAAPWDRWLARTLVLVFGARLFWMIEFQSTHFRGSVAALAFTALLFLALDPSGRSFSRRFFEQGWLRHLGKYSYALYVFHEMFEIVWKKWFGPTVLGPIMGMAAGQLTYIVLAFCGSYALARASWVLIERPFLRMKDAGT